MDRQSLLDKFDEIETGYGLPSGYLDQTAQIESGYNPRSHNELSGAKGMFQFISSTAREYGLKNPWDPVASADAAARYAVKNQTALRDALGRDPTAGELYLAHQQGTDGAVRLLSNPNARAADVVGSKAIMANGGNVQMTAGQFANRWTSRYTDVDSLNRKLMAFSGDDKVVSGADWEQQFLAGGGENRSGGGQVDRIMQRYKAKSGGGKAAAPEEDSNKPESADINRILSRYKQTPSEATVEAKPVKTTKETTVIGKHGMAGGVPTGQRIAEGFESFPDATAPEHQRKFNRMMDFVTKNPTHPYSVDVALGLAGLMGVRPGVALAATPLAGKLLGKAAQGSAFAEGMKLMGDKGSKTLEMLLEMAK